MGGLGGWWRKRDGLALARGKGGFKAWWGAREGGGKGCVAKKLLGFGVWCRALGVRACSAAPRPSREGDV
eukprot:352926-Chlamydomonas_euryale.AAC.1